MARGVWGGGGVEGGAIIPGRRLIEGRLLFEAVHMNCDVDSHFQNKIVLRQVPDCVSSWINGVTLPTDLCGAFIFS